VSTGKWSQGAGGHTTGKVNCMETVGSGALVSSTQQPSSHLGARSGPSSSQSASLGSLVWVGTDRGYIESFRVETSGKVLKGCRVPVETPTGSSNSRMTTNCVTSLATDGKVLVATVLGSHNLFMFKVVAEGSFGTVTPFRAFNAGSEVASGSLRSVALGRSSSSGGTSSGLLASCGTDDGSVLFFDLDKNTKPCVDRLTGHAKPLTHTAFNQESNLLVSADLSGQVIVWKK